MSADSYRQPVAQIAAGLHFYQFEIDLAWIFQPVLGAHRGCTSIHSRCTILVSPPTVTRPVPLHYKPMLGAVMMELQR
jgi:hypothetical protein